MKSLAIMQPYFMPYLGYFQLVESVDQFVFLDDVNFIKKGWINRNRILCDESEHLFSIPLTAASQNKRINEISLALEPRWIRKFFGTLQRAYQHAPYYDTTTKILSSCLEMPHQNIGQLARHSIISVAEYVGLSTKFVLSSAKYQNTHLTGEDRILDICLQEQATHYLNPGSGQNLYSAESFLQHNVELRFLAPRLTPYPQSSTEFIPGLSVIDAMMHNAPAALQQLMSPVANQL